MVFQRDMDMHGHTGPIEIHTNVTATVMISLVLLAISLGVILPYGFACKQAGKSKRHLIVQITGGALAGIGLFLGHFSGIERYNPWLADIGVFWSLGVVGGSLLLYVYVPKGVLAHMHRLIDRLHTIASVIQPLISWVTVGLSVISLLGYCSSNGDHTGQCLAHGIMGTAFVTYGIIMLAMLYVGEHFLKRTNRSQEFYDSTVITIWGIVNTFTEHRWGQSWGHGDVQHTTMGVVWWALGMVGMYLSWDRVNNRPQRNHIPALIIIVTGYAMLTHTQHLAVSTSIHFMFGVALTLSGLCRIIEVSFVLHDKPHEGKFIKTWQYLTPFFMIESGMLFMSATEEAMQFLDSQGIMAPPYVLVITSFASLVFLGALFVIQSYMTMKQRPQLKEGDYELPFLDGEESVHDADHEFDLSDTA